MAISAGLGVTLFGVFFFQTALFAAVPEKTHGLDGRPDCHPVLRVLFGQWQLFEVSAGGQSLEIAVTCHQRWHIHAGPITGAQDLDQFSARGEGWGC